MIKNNVFNMLKNIYIIFDKISRYFQQKYQEIYASFTYFIKTKLINIEIIKSIYKNSKKI